MARVAFRDVTKVYPGPVVALEGLTLDVADGEFLILVGPSGCGKSTALRMVAGLERISHGSIAIGDRVVNDVPPKDRDVAMVFQNYALYPHMTVDKNLAFGLRQRRIAKQEARRRVEEISRMLGIEEDRVNVNGGAVALGHPIGASGARILGSLLFELRRRGGGLGCAAICSGGGQGDAVILKVS